MSQKKKPQLSVTLDGAPAYLYFFSKGSYEDKQRFLCAYPEKMSPRQVRDRVAQAAKRLPESIEFDYMAEPLPLDLFERAVELAGFVAVDDQVLVGVSLPESNCFTERDFLEECLRVGKARVRRWEYTGDRFVLANPTGPNEEQAIDVSMQIGRVGALWYMRTVHDGDGEDLTDDVAFDSQSEVRAAARLFAASVNDAEPGETARAYLKRKKG